MSAADYAPRAALTAKAGHDLIVSPPRRGSSVVEHRSEKPGVDSSILSPATIFLKRALPLAVAAVLASWALAQNAAAPVSKNAAQIDWKASGSLPPGAEYHLIYEDPKTHAVQTLVRFPKGYGLPPHSHSADETIVVLKGKLVLEIGGKSETLSAGGYAMLPAGTVFSIRTAGYGGADFLAAFNGPFDMKASPAVAKP